MICIYRKSVALYLFIRSPLTLRYCKSYIKFLFDKYAELQLFIHINMINLLICTFFITFHFVQFKLEITTKGMQRQLNTKEYFLVENS